METINYKPDNYLLELSCRYLIYKKNREEHKFNFEEILTTHSKIIVSTSDNVFFDDYQNGVFHIDKDTAFLKKYFNISGSKSLIFHSLNEEILKIIRLSQEMYMDLVFLETLTEKAIIINKDYYLTNKINKYEEEKLRIKKIDDSQILDKIKIDMLSTLENIRYVLGD